MMRVFQDRYFLLTLKTVFEKFLAPDTARCVRPRRA